MKDLVVTNCGNGPTPPDKNWTTDDLTRFAKVRLNAFGELHEQLVSLVQRSALELFLAGHALHLLKEKLGPKGGFEKWLDDHGIPKTTAYEARKLYSKAMSRWDDRATTEIAKLSITEAKTELGVISERKPTESGTAVMREPNSAEEAAEASEVRRADEMLIGIADTLTKMVGWDRNDLDAKLLDITARKCINLLEQFLLDGDSPSEKTPQSKPPKNPTKKSNKKAKVQHVG